MSCELRGTSPKSMRAPETGSTGVRLRRGAGFHRRRVFVPCQGAGRGVAGWPSLEVKAAEHRWRDSA